MQTDLTGRQTGFGNRTGFTVSLDKWLAEGSRPKFLRDINMLISYDKKRPFSLFCVDICAFSQYNELFSAEVGDSILQEVIRRMERPFGSYLYRINGDVFVGISLSAEGADLIADRLQRILTSPISVGNTAFTLQVWITACQYPVHGNSPVALLDCIQSALRFAKESGQKVILYNGELSRMIHMEAKILHRLKQSILENTLEVWYQPIVYLKTGRFFSAEALVRLPDENGGYFSAGHVISLAERNGMVEQLGEYVLKQAGQFMCSHARERGLLHMCINLSVQQLLVENSADHLLDLIRKFGIDPKHITLEITESVLIQSIEQTSAALSQLREAGIRIALDDFGVGYSSLNYLSNLPVDVIKIDRSLTKQVSGGSVFAKSSSFIQDMFTFPASITTGNSNSIFPYHRRVCIGGHSADPGQNHEFEGADIPSA